MSAEGTVCFVPKGSSGPKLSIAAVLSYVARDVKPKFLIFNLFV